MNAGTLKALKLSIRHWQANVRKAERGLLSVDDITDNKCELCQRFFGCSKSRECCPVKIASKTRGCGCLNTPWYLVYKSLCGETTRKAVLVKHAKEELKFLKSLLPAKKSK